MGDAVLLSVHLFSTFCFRSQVLRVYIARATLSSCRNRLPCTRSSKFVDGAALAVLVHGKAQARTINSTGQARDIVIGMELSGHHTYIEVGYNPLPMNHINMVRERNAF